MHLVLDSNWLLGICEKELGYNLGDVCIILFPDGYELDTIRDFDLHYEDEIDNDAKVRNDIRRYIRNMTPGFDIESVKIDIIW